MHLSPRNITFDYSYQINILFNNTFHNLKWKWKTTDYGILLFWNKSGKVLQTFLIRCIQGPFFMCGTHKSVQKGWFHAYGLRNMFKVHSQVQTCSVCGSEPKTSRSSWLSIDKVSLFAAHKSVQRGDLMCFGNVALKVNFQSFNQYSMWVKHKTLKCSWVSTCHAGCTWQMYSLLLLSSRFVCSRSQINWCHATWCQQAAHHTMAQPLRASSNQASVEIVNVPWCLQKQELKVHGSTWWTFHELRDEMKPTLFYSLPSRGEPTN